jgi:DNA-binding GntR family transcriptional regulator
MVSRDSAEPPYVQVAAMLRDRVRRMKSGDRLPSVRDMARQYEVSTNTVLKAMAILVDEGLVTTTPGWGTFKK